MAKKSRKSAVKAKRSPADLREMIRLMNSSTTNLKQTALAIAKPAPALQAPPASSLVESVQPDSIRLVELKLTPEEEAVCAEGVPIDEVLVKPTSSGQVYLPHASYTRWMNRAFGRCGWNMLKVGDTVQTISSQTREGKRRFQVEITYILFVHDKPVARATGAAEYFEGSLEQNAGDAVESTVAYGLRRLMKRIGIGLELWDKLWIDQFLREHCLMVQVDNGRAWRRKVDPPLRGERGPSGAGQDYSTSGTADFIDAETVERPQRQQSSHGSDGSGSQRISERQRGRMMGKIRDSGRNMDVVKAWIKSEYGYDHGEQVERKHYDAICAAIDNVDDQLPRRR